MYVYRNGVLIGEAEVQISDPRRPLGAGVFVVLDGVTHEPSPLAPDRPKRRWMAVGLPSHNGQLPARHEIGERIHPPAQFSRLVYELLQPGATLMITDRPTGPARNPNPTRFSDHGRLLMSSYRENRHPASSTGNWIPADAGIDVAVFIREKSFQGFR